MLKRLWLLVDFWLRLSDFQFDPKPPDFIVLVLLLTCPRRSYLPIGLTAILKSQLWLYHTFLVSSCIFFMFHRTVFWQGNHDVVVTDMTLHLTVCSDLVLTCNLWGALMTEFPLLTILHQLTRFFKCTYGMDDEIMSTRIATELYTLAILFNIYFHLEHIFEWTRLRIWSSQ